MKHIIKNTIAILNDKERRKLWMLIVLDIVISIADIGFLALLLFVIHFYTQPSHSSKFDFLPAWVLDHNSLLLIALFFLLFSLKNLCAFLVSHNQYRFVSQVTSRISHQKLRNYLEGGYANYVGVDSAAHIRKISHEPVEFCYHILAGIQQIITQLVLIALTIAAILIFNAKLFLLLLVILLPPVVVVFYIIRKKLRTVRQHTKRNNEKSLQHLQEALGGFIESNIFDKNEFFLGRYDHYQRKLNKHLSDMMSVQGIASRIIEIFALMGLFILIAINKWSGNADNTAIINIGTFMAAAYKIIPGIVKILNTNGQITTYQYTIQDLLQNEIIPNKKKKIFKENIQSIRFRNVSFKYNDHLILDKLHLTIEAGDFFGISGHSGKGKTTILNLLMGFLEPADGDILINDIPSDSTTRQQYWQHISYVKQQSFLIHDTILRNIILDENNVDKKKLAQAIEVAGLAELIESFPEKLDKLIAENGKNISGGQRQRIAIARALYKDADIILLDEPFNELDESSECSLLNHFIHLSKTGKLVVLITHSKTSLSFCSKIFSLDEKE